MNKKLLQEFDLVIQLHIFDKAYDKEDFMRLIDLFNEMHSGSMSVSVINEKNKNT